MILSKTQIKKIAQEIVDENIESGKPLQECVIIKIKGMDLNPEQVKRIVENTNIMSFLKRYEGAAPDDRDEATEFDVLSPHEIAKEKVKKTAALHKTAVDVDYADFFLGPPGTSYELEKTATYKTETPVIKEWSAKKKNATLSQLKTAIEKLDQKTAEALYDYQDALHKLSNQCREVYFDTEELFKNAAAAFGDKSIPHITLLCKSLGSLAPKMSATVDTREVSFDKVASELVVRSKGMYFDDDTPGLDTFKTLVECHRERQKCSAARDYLFHIRENLAHRWGIV